MRRLFLVSLALAALGACSQYVSCSSAPVQTVDSLNTAQPVRPGDVPEARTIGVAFLGDSLTAGQGLTSEEAYPNRIQELFVEEGYGEVDVLNGGVSGDTTAGGRRRVEQLLTGNTKILVVALGGNDALRGISVSDTRANLVAIIETAHKKGVDVLLAGMEAPTNYGQDYQAAFRATFVDVARQYPQSVAYVPFLLEGVAGNPALNQADGIHPTAEGAKVIANLLYPKLRDIVDRISNSIR
jgi:acyl-CoA thioesterase-1